MGLWFCLCSGALDNWDSAITGMVNAMTPVFVMIIGALFYKQRITALMIIGLFLAFAGTALLMFYGSGGNHKFNFFCKLHF